MNMAKYLRELVISGTKMFPNKEHWKQFNRHTAYIDEAFYAKLKRNVPSSIGKLCIDIAPITTENKHFKVAEANYDYLDTDIFNARVPFDLNTYIDASSEAKNQIVYTLLKQFLNSPFAKSHFDVSFLLNILEEVKDAGFAHVIENKKRTMNEQKNRGVRFRKELDMHNMKIFALISGKKSQPEEKLLIGIIEGSEGVWSAGCKSTMAFTEEDTIAYYEQRTKLSMMEQRNIKVMKLVFTKVLNKS
jgi:hypothetical protein